MWTPTRAVELQGHSADKTERKQLSATVSHEQWYWSVQKTASEQFASENVAHGPTDSRKQKEVPAALTSTRVKRADPQWVKRADPQRVKRADKTHLRDVTTTKKQTI